MKYLIALLTAATGILHLLVGFNIYGGMGATNILLVLNGVGYLVLLVLYLMTSGSGRGAIRWILLAYTLITLIGYFVININNNFGFGNTVALIIKAIELLLVILLFLDRGGERVVAPPPAPAATRVGTSPTLPHVDSADLGTTVGTMAGTAAGGLTTAAAAAAAGAVAMEDRAVEVAEETADLAENVVTETYESTTETIGGAADYVSDTVEDVVEGAGEVVEEAAETVDEAAEYVGDKAEAAMDSVEETVAEAGEAAEEAVGYVGDKAEDAYEAAAEVTEGVVEGVAESGEAAGDTIRGSGIAVAATADDVVEEAGDILEMDAAALNATQLGEEPTAEELRADLEEYLKSFGPSSEFRKNIEYVEGIGAAYGQKLRAIGIATVLDLMVNGATRRGRKHISDQTGIAQSMILTWVNHVDLFRIKGVAEEYADLLEQSGVDTVVELAQRNPANLHKRMLEINQQKELVRRAPHISEVQSWVEQAKSLRRLIYY